MPATIDGLASREPQKREVARMPGLLDKPLFLAMFRYVSTEGYREKPFQDWLKTNAG
jgi:thioredoxin-related protein